MGDGSGEGACGRGDVGCDCNGDEAREAAVGSGAGEGDRGERGMEGQRCEGLCFGTGLFVGVDLVERGTTQ